MVQQQKSTLVGAVWPVNGSASALRGLALAVLGTALLTASAKIQVPFWPVPMTMQTFVVLVIGATYGARLGAATVALYLAYGAVGLPVFAAGGGLVYLAGPTGGYLIGFLAAAAVVGWLAERGFDRRWPSALAVFLFGDGVIFAFGVLWLGYHFGVATAVQGGLLPFLPGEVLKIVLAMAVLPFAWKMARET